MARATISSSQSCAEEREAMDHADRPGHRDLGITLIALFKFVKAVLLFAIALGAVGLVRGGIPHTAEVLLSVFSSGTERRVTQAVVSRITNMRPTRVAALGVGAFLYGALFLVEGTGLWLQRPWAEYLTVVATASFIPFEIYELARRVTATRVVALVLNIAIVIYLIVRLRRRSREK
jgi:uncharacterized membrane protein (DUF2068 family)